MALVIADRVRETSTTAGTGTFTLDGAVTGYQTFSSAIGNGNTTYYVIANSQNGEWEVGVGTVGAGTLARTTLLSSSTGSAIDFAAGTKDVFVSLPAVKLINNDLGTLAVAHGGTGATTLTGVVKGNGTSAFTAATAGTDYVAPGGALGTPSSGTLTNCSGLPVSTGISGFGTNVATWLGTPSSANLASAVTDETGSGSLVFNTTPTLTGARITLSALGTLTTGTTTIDLATAQVFTATITAANTITIAFSNAPSAGTSQVVLLRLTDAGGGTIVWPANTKFTAGTAPTLTTSGVDVLGVYYDITTTTYMVFVIGLDVKVP